MLVLQRHIDESFANDTGLPIELSLHGYDTHYETTHGGDHSFVDTARKKGNVDVVAGIGHLPEGTHHTEHRAEEANHRRTRRDGGHHGKPLLELGYLKVAGILQSGLHLDGRTVDASEALHYHI